MTTDSRKIAPQSAAAFMGGLMFLCVILMLYLTITQWYAASTMSVALGVLSLVMAPLAAFLAAQQVDDLQVADLIPSASVNVALGLAITLVVTGAWRQEGTRHGALSHGARLSDGSAAERALQDPSPSVSLAACRWLLQHGQTTQRNKMLDTLAEAPALAVQCLSGADVSGRVLNARKLLVQRWSYELLAEDALRPSDARLSALASFTREEADGAAALMACALGHTEQAERTRCAETLVTAQLVGDELIARAERSDNPAALALWPARLVAASSHQYGLSPQDKINAVKLELLSKEVRARALSHGCDSLRAGDEALHAQLEALANSSCSVKTTQLEKLHLLWPDVCEPGFESKKAKSDPIGTFCARLSAQLTARAVTRARGHLYSAIAQHLSDQLTAAIKRGNKVAQNDLRQQLTKQLGEAGFQRYYMSLSPQARQALDSYNAGTTETSYEAGVDESGEEVTNEQLLERSARENRRDHHDYYRSQLKEIERMKLGNKAHQQQLKSLIRE